jgi:serine/threonine protein kinase
VSAKVYRCIDNFTKEPFAMKVIDIEFAWGRSLASIRNKYVGLLKSESKLMMECNHENLLKCIEVHENKELKLMIL